MICCGFLENTGVSAYDGAIAHISAAKLLTVGATIATVEARHASYLNLLNRDVPFPSAFDEPVAPRKICKAVQAEDGGFITDSEMLPASRRRRHHAAAEGGRRRGIRRPSRPPVPGRLLASPQADSRRSAGALGRCPRVRAGV
jgi:Ferritin-like domain